MNVSALIKCNIVNQMQHIATSIHIHLYCLIFNFFPTKKKIKKNLTWYSFQQNNKIK